MTPRVERDEVFKELAGSIHNSSLPMVVTDPRQDDNPIVAANAAFTALTGYDEAEAVGRNCRFLAGKDTHRETSAILLDAVVDAKSTFAELLNYRRDGTPFRNAVMIAPIFDSDGQLSYFIGSQMEVGEGLTSSTQRREDAAAKVARLSPRQRQVLQEMIQGYRNKQIAPRLGISEKTVKMHRASMLEKLGVPTSADAMRIAVEAGL